MRVAWLDCSAGASGDMLLGAFLDAGADLEAVNAAVAAVDPSLSVTVDRTSRHQLTATKATVRVDRAPHPETTPPESATASQGEGHGDGHGHGHGHGDRDGNGDGPVRGHGHGPARAWREVRGLIEAAGLAPAVRDRALDTFARLARAEAAAHGVEPETVHFHEVGALDAIADIVGVAAASASLGIERFVVSTIALGGGRQVRGQHGGIPVPGPAVLHVLTEAGAPVVGGTAPYEMTTPTGAALLASLADEYGMLPPLRIVHTGVGAGGRDPVEVPNVVRVVLGDAPIAPAGPAAPAAEPSPQTATGHQPAGRELVYETNVDDLDPRIWPRVLARLLEAGAADAWLTPILMKKGRPAHTLSVLVGPAAAAAVRAVILTETSAIGLREYPIAKHAAEREFRTVEVDGRTITVKLAWYDGRVVNVQPEYEDVVAAATELEQPVKTVMARAIAAARDFWFQPS